MMHDSQIKMIKINRKFDITFFFFFVKLALRSNVLWGQISIGGSLNETNFRDRHFR